MKIRIKYKYIKYFSILLILGAIACFFAINKGNDAKVAGLAVQVVTPVPTDTPSPTMTPDPTPTEVPTPTLRPTLTPTPIPTSTPTPLPTRAMTQNQSYSQEPTEQQKEEQAVRLLSAYKYCLEMNEMAKNTYPLSSIYIDATDYCNSSLENGFFYHFDGCPPGAAGICFEHPRQF